MPGSFLASCTQMPTKLLSDTPELLTPIPRRSAIFGLTAATAPRDGGLKPDS